MLDSALERGDEGHEDRRGEAVDALRDDVEAEEGEGEVDDTAARRGDLGKGGRKGCGTGFREAAQQRGCGDQCSRREEDAEEFRAEGDREAEQI